MTIVIYGGDNCPWCVKAKALADRCGLGYLYRDLSNDQTARDELKRLLPNQTKYTIPQIWWYKDYVGGHDDFLALLKEKGYNVE